ncbi:MULTISPECIES: enoyl-CoA hydratase-related protein [Pseudofrankia]|uniref:enoyl-CoA hydratase-related protein n=1 Tax=Pseudofrankia TaxID=2994363 RepID=UPI0022B7F49B|nr:MULTISPECIES: enoyl-CoA hydratase-related protein [Pseudofrankia]
MRHLRVADRSAFYALPEGQRGLFLGGGGSVRLPGLIGVARVMDLMLTGRRLTADEGQAAGLTQYVVETGTVGTAALDLARKIARNAPQANFAVLQALPRIAPAVWGATSRLGALSCANSASGIMPGYGVDGDVLAGAQAARRGRPGCAA